eukprot:5152017-Prymnesium_polylepis.1
MSALWIGDPLRFIVPTPPVWSTRPRVGTRTGCETTTTRRRRALAGPHKRTAQARPTCASVPPRVYVHHTATAWRCATPPSSLMGTRGLMYSMLADCM